MLGGVHRGLWKYILIVGSQDFKKAEMTKTNKWITNVDLLYSTWNSAQCYMVAWMGEEFGGEWIYAYASLFTWKHHSIADQLNSNIKLEVNGEKRILVVLCNTREVSRSPWSKLH